MHELVAVPYFSEISNLINHIGVSNRAATGDKSGNMLDFYNILSQSNEIKKKSVKQKLK